MGPFIVHKRILMIDKQIEHAADYFSKANSSMLMYSIYTYPKSNILRDMLLTLGEGAK